MPTLPLRKFLLMQTYIALLRGINVSGQKKIKMADLKIHLAELDFQNLQTYIQSGNIVFETTPGSTEKLQTLISKKIAEKYGFEVPTLVKTANELQEALQRNPFHPEGEAEPNKMYFTFLATLPTPDRVAHLHSFAYPPEQFVLEGKNIYFYSPNSYGRAKMNNNFFENKLKVPATTRNWRTVKILFDMATEKA